MNMPTSIPTATRPVKTDQALLVRLAAQSRLPDGDFAELLPWSVLHHLIMEFPTLSHKAFDIMTSTLMLDRAGLREHYGDAARQMDEDRERVENIAALLGVLSEFARETMDRLDKTAEYCRRNRPSFE